MNLRLRVTRAQREVVACPARFMGLFAGRRWGKTLAWRFRALSLIARGLRLAYITPSYSQLKPEFDTFRYHPEIRELLSSYGCGVQPYPHLRFVTGAELQFRSFDRPGNVRGQGLHEVWFDEIQDVRRETDFWSVIRPLISDRRGNLIVSGQFRGKNWFYRQFFLPGQSGPDSRRPLYASWRFPSSSGLAFAGVEGQRELEIVKTQMSLGVYNQEYECIPAQDSAAVFRCVERCIGGAPQDKPIRGHAHVTAWDTGKVADPSGLLTLDSTSGLVCDTRVLPQGMEFTEQLEIAVATARRYGALLLMDTTGAGTQDRLLDFARAQYPNTRGMIFSRGDKDQMVNAVALWLERKRLTIPAQFGELLGQLLHYEYERRGSFYVYRAPPGEHDDLVAALAMAVAAADRHWLAVPGSLPAGLALH